MSFGQRWRTLRHFRPQQVLWRGYQRGLARFCAIASQPLETALSKHGYEATNAPDLALHRIAPDAARLARARAISEGRFTFLNRTANYSQGIDWAADGFDRLWRFNLHYFDFGLDLALAYYATRDVQYAERFIAVSSDWLASCPLGKGDAWHPYPLSLRLVNWIWAWHLFGEAIASFKPAMLRSMAAQARYLRLHLERDIGGNHLIKNVKALVMAGAFLGDTRIMHAGLSRLKAQILVQVLPDGAHFERSPMYHEQVLQDLSEVAWYLRTTQGQTLPWLDSAIARMADWLMRVTFPDGEIALFGDSAHGISPRPGAILALVNGILGTDYPSEDDAFANVLVGSRCGRRQLGDRVELLPDSGFFVTRHKDHVFVLDCGPFAPDELPAHGHCDALSFELCLGAERFIVDSGTFAYTGSRRPHYRGTAAHNTVAIPSREQSEIWGDFRAGRRARIVKRTLAEAGCGYWMEVAHDGYMPLVHMRQIWYVPGAFWLIADTLEGKVPPGSTSRLHVHPDRTVLPSECGAILHGEDANLQVCALGGELRWEEGSYSERFGHEVLCQVLVQELDRMGKAAFLLVPSTHPVALERVSPDSYVVTIGETQRYILEPGVITLKPESEEKSSLPVDITAQ